jgi:hypothetical protein
MSDFPTLGHWLFSGLRAQNACCLSQPDRRLIFGTFNPDAPSDRLLVSKEQFEARYGLPFTNAGSLIGEGRVPDKLELQERVRQADNPCGLRSNASYMVTETDYSDLRYVARSGRPVWEAIETLRTFAAPTAPPPPTGSDTAAILDELTGLMNIFRAKLPAKGGGRYVAAGRVFLEQLDKLVQSARR